eukprot:scaffold81605_cov28-Tisochrysis_lutea.AAC.6
MPISWHTYDGDRDRLTNLQSLLRLKDGGAEHHRTHVVRGTRASVVHDNHARSRQAIRALGHFRRSMRRCACGRRVCPVLVPNVDSGWQRVVACAKQTMAIRR